MDRMMRTSLLVCTLLSLGDLLAAQGQQPAAIRGHWRTPGGAIVRVAPCESDPNTLCANLLQLEPNAPQFDTNNPDPAQHTRKLCGLQIGYGFHLTDPNHAEDGHLYDPKSGKTYKGAMTSSGDSPRSARLRRHQGFRPV